MIKTEKNQTSKVTDEVDQLVQRSKKALAILKSYTQAQIDDLCEKVAVAALDNHMKLAKLAVEETGRGVVEDKAIKNIYASEYIWNSMRHDKTVGVIKEDDEDIDIIATCYRDELSGYTLATFKVDVNVDDTDPTDVREKLVDVLSCTYFQEDPRYRCFQPDCAKLKI